MKSKVREKIILVIEVLLVFALIPVAQVLYLKGKINELGLVFAAFLISVIASVNAIKKIRSTKDRSSAYERVLYIGNISVILLTLFLAVLVALLLIREFIK